jgi:hypothetical protein
MRVAALFLLSLFFCLAGGSHVNYAAAPSFKTQVSPTHQLEKTPRVVSADAGKYLLAATYDLNEENEYLIGVEDDSEDDIIRKHILPASYFLAFYYTFVIGYSPHNFTDRLSLYEPPCNTGSSKSILQRVLRL